MYSLREEYFACLALRYTPGLGPKSWSGILRHYNSAYEGLKNSENWHGLALASEKSAEAASKELWRKRAEEEYRAVLNLKLGVLPWTHPFFPARIREIADPPTCLYYLGDLTLLHNPAVALVGSRNCSPLGLEYAAKISADLSRYGVTVVSGFANGVDSTAHRAALREIGSSIAVLGTGLDVDSYPAGSEGLRSGMIESGLIVSEFPPGTPPYARNFPFRNRLISGLSTGVLVIEAGIASGSLVTARLGAEQGREVMAMPGPIGDNRFAGCLKLIKEGAPLVETAEDVLVNIRHALESDVTLHEAAPAPRIEKREIVPYRFGDSEQKVNPVASSRPPAKLDLESLEPPESDIAVMLEQSGRMHIDEIARNCGLDVSITGSALLGMEVKGVVVCSPGMYYDLKRS